MREHIVFEYVGIKPVSFLALRMLLLPRVLLFFTTASWSILVWVKCFLFPIVLHGWEMCYLSSFGFWFFSCIPFGWHKQFRTGPSIFLCFHKILSLRSISDTHERPAFWGKQILPLSTVSVSYLYLSSYLSSLNSFYWPCKMDVVIRSWVLVMKWRIHSVAA